MKPEAEKVGLVMIGVIVVVLAVFLLITVVIGDSTNDIGENQSPAPASPRPS